MSNAHAIAAVTKVLVNLIDEALKAANLSGPVGSDITVSALPPKRVKLSESTDPNQLNLFLYLVQPNLHFLNLPTRDSAGARTQNTPLALELYYLVTAYGAADFASEIILGHTLQVLHENSVLNRDAIRAKLKPGANPKPAELALAGAGLADQGEQIKISPEKITTEEMSRLWSAFSAEYRPSVAYRVTVVMIQSQASTKSALPVLQRGIYVRSLSTPLIERVASQSAADQPTVENQPILPGAILVLAGQRLRGEVTRVVIDGVKLDATSAFISDTHVDVPLPATLRAGPHAVLIAHEVPMGSPPTPHSGTESNVVTFALRPMIVGAVTASATQLTVNLEPRVTPAQHVRVLLNERAPPSHRTARAYSFTAPAGNGIEVAAGETETETVTFSHQNVAAGEYLVRVQVDGAESVLQTDPATGKFSGPNVTMP